MTKDEALRLALEHLEWSTPQGKMAYETIKQDLAQPEPEPVAKVVAKISNVRSEIYPAFEKGTLLYTSPPKREPLTDEQLHALFDSPLTPTGLEWARKIEAAHGIKGDA